jgi:hypothetical protein
MNGYLHVGAVVIIGDNDNNKYIRLGMVWRPAEKPFIDWKS